MRICEVIDCTRPRYGFGLCNMHYQRERRGGVVTDRVPATLLPELERLIGNRVVTDEGCWQWTGGTNGVGYGVTTVRSHKVYVHRLSYTLAVGPIPDGLVVDHLCRNTLCFNPEHLEAVTHTENVRRSPLIGAKTHCIRGHEFTDENTYVSPAGARQCIECRRERSRKQRATRLERENAAREGVTPCR